MARYVKFYRGNTAAFEALVDKNNDTLYFITEEDSSIGKLYLGSKLIAGGSLPENEGPKISSLKDLEGVLLSEGIEDESIFVYDKDVNAWVNKPLEDLVFIGATPNSAGMAGMVPAPESKEYNLFLRGDGEWATPTIDHTILTLNNTDFSTHSELIAQVNFNPISGDIIIIKDLIAKDKWQYTAYVYSNNKWSAMDGNYDASNVYFSEDLMTTTAIGNIKLTGGQAIIPAAGKNLKELFESIYVKEENPKTTQPYVTLTFSQAKAYEVGTTVSPTYSATFYPGSYTYGPATGVTVNSWSVGNSEGGTLHTKTGTFPTITVRDNTNYSITATAYYGDGEIPVTNLGNEYATGQIKSGEDSDTKGSITGYRNSFYGTFTNKNVLTASAMRTYLTKSGQALSNGSSVVVPVPLGAYRVVFAYPATLQDLTSVKDKNAMGSEIVSGFKQTSLSIPGNNSYPAIDYKVYYIDYAEANDKENEYTFTI